jgi:hypothetical protein
MRFRRLSCLLLAAVALAGCSRGSDGSDIGNRRLDDALAGSAPACSVTWVEGKILPLDYRGCEENGSLQGSASLYDCLDGDTLALYGERFYARLGKRVRAVVGDIADDPAYAEFWHDCRG